MASFRDWKGLVRQLAPEASDGFGHRYESAGKHFVFGLIWLDERITLNGSNVA